MAKIAKANKEEEIIDVPALVITPEKAPVIDGNFAQVEAVLLAWKDRVSGIEMTEENMSQVEIVKKEAVALRNRLTKIQTDTKKLYFNDPKAVFDKKMAHLLSLVGDVEGSADKVLDAKEQQRRDGLNEALDVYKDGFQAKYKLDNEYIEQVEYKKEYYNTTAVEKESKDDLEQQFIDLKKKQDARAASIRLIEATCKGEPRLNVRHWIDQLAYKDIATVTEEITSEKERLAELDRGDTGETGEAEAEETSDKPKLLIGLPATITFASDFPDRLKRKKFEMEYPCDMGEDIKAIFLYLKKYNIKVKTQKEPEAVF
jgi:hypothetical protein